MRIMFDEGENVFLAEAVNIMTVAVVPIGPLETVAQPALRNPLLNLAVILAQSLFKVADRVTFGDSARMAKGFDFCYH